MIPNPIHKVLSTIQRLQVRALLMGGQACVFYGGAEFSRDTDFAILAEVENLERLSAAMKELQATVIAVPALSLDHLLQGHAVHFRCQHPEAAGMRVDVMARMRGVDDFDALWQRRTTLQGADGTIYELMSLPDLIQAKKTQRDKDWPMIRRLIEADHAATPAPTSSQVMLWLREARTPELLIELARSHSASVGSIIAQRPLLIHALTGNQPQLEHALREEEFNERQRDKDHWLPLKRELEQMRRSL